MVAKMKPGLDLLIVCPGNNKLIYQELAKEYAAVEPPVWGGLLANFARHKGFGVQIVDQEAEGLSADEIVATAEDLNPRLVAIVVYGQQPSASTQNMSAAIEICRSLKSRLPHVKTIMIGGHPSALPERTLIESESDFVCEGEGPYTLLALLKSDRLDDASDLRHVPGLWFRENGGAACTPTADLIPANDLATELPGMAWDLLPMDAYRACNWHCFEHIHDRQPYASLYTSLGCPFKCSFCCINAPFGKRTIRCWDPQFVVEQLEHLATEYNIKNVKIADEMFVLNPRHVTELCDLIIERRLGLNLWAYARIDTVRDELLVKLKRAGFNWLCLGIESGSKHVRDGVEKGRFGTDDIEQVVRKIKDAGISVIGNYIFGLPDDDLDSMQATLDLALKLNCEMANFYSAMAYPGSPLYSMAVENNWSLPEEWHDFSQHAYQTLPLPTEHLRAGEVLAFRDKAWQTYFTHPAYLNFLGDKFGPDVVAHVSALTRIKLKRKYAEN